MKRFFFLIIFTNLLALEGWAAAKLGPVEFGGQFRTRYEVNDPASFTKAGEQSTTDFLLFRTRLWAQSELEEKGLKVFLEIQDSRTAGSEASVVANTANLDLKRGYLDVMDLGGHQVDLRVGRQTLKYGDQRLISPLEWSNVGRSWDGAKLFTDYEKVNIDLFYAVITEVSDIYNDQKFSGAYSTYKLGKKQEADLYVLWRHSGDANSTTGTGASLNVNQWTPGIRYAGKYHGLDYTVECVLQAGDSAGSDIEASAAAGILGYTADVKTQPRIGFSYEYASGDKNPTDNKTQTFDSLFPFGHYYQGHADVFGWKNSNSWLANFTIKPVEKWWAQITYHKFNLAESKDAWYGANGAAITQDVTGTSGKDVGQEIDIHFKTTFRDIINIWFGYARFMGGDFVKKTAVKRDKDFAFLQGAINF